MAEECSIMVKIQQKFMGIIWQKYAGHNWHLYFKILFDEQPDCPREHYDAIILNEDDPVEKF